MERSLKEFISDFDCCLHVAERLLDGAHGALENLAVLSSWLETSIDVFFTLCIAFFTLVFGLLCVGEKRMQREWEKTEAISPMCMIRWMRQTSLSRSNRWT